MTRWLLIALAVSACAKGKDSAPAPTNTSADTAAQTPAVITTPAAPTTGGSDPEAARKQAAEHARNHASLGVSAKTDAFDPIGEGNGTAKGDPKPKKLDPQTRDRNDANTVTPAPDREGSSNGVRVDSGDKTRGTDKELIYRALIGAVKLDGKAAPAALVKAFRANVTKVQACYVKTLAASPKLVGQLQVTFTVLPTGTLTAGAVGASTIKQSALESCGVRSVMRQKTEQVPLAGSARR